MLDVLGIAQQRLDREAAPPACAIATIVSVEGSVPRPVGTSMLVEAEGSIHGSLSGGCVESAVLETCREVLETGESAVHRFGVSEEDAFAVGLMCGGSLEVLVQPFEPIRPVLDDPLAVVLQLPRDTEADGTPADDDVPTTGAAPDARAPGGRSGAEIALIRDADSVGAALAPLVPPQVLEAAISQTSWMIDSGRTGTVRLAPPTGRGQPIELFVETRIRPAHLVVFGANAFGQALVAAARPLGLRITLCDQRPAFTDPRSFPGAEVVRAWPHRFLSEAAARGDVDARSIVCVLTHDPKVDVPALTTALDLDLAYVGAMGSRRSDRARRAALREAGVCEEALARLHSPIGLDLGAVTPAEIAVAILGEILAVRSGPEAVVPLRDSEGPLHQRSLETR